MTLPTHVRLALEAWIEAAQPIGRLLQGQGGTTWDQARSHYLEGLARLFPAPPGVAFSRVDMGGVP